MKDFWGDVRERAKAKGKRIVFPEGEEERVIKAARIVRDEGLADVVLLGDPDKIGIKGIEIINPQKYGNKKKLDRVIESIEAGKRLKKGLDGDWWKDNFYFGGLLTRVGEVDGFVGGAVTPTAKTVKTAIYLVGSSRKVSRISGFFLMEVPDCSYGEEGRFLFADCAVIPNPTPWQLANIAGETAKSAINLFGWEPRVAMLSFSTHGSAEHSSIDKIRVALQIARNENPSLLIDGELQLDAAIIPEVAQRKSTNTILNGRANILIFPNLNSGNIGYKITERLARSRATGPILQGLKKPVNDLSRGCSVKDIVNVTAITVLQT